MRALLVVMALAGCAAGTERRALMVPADMTTCMPTPDVPAAPPRVRTPAILANFAIRLELAREAERARGDDCAAKLQSLSAFVEAHK